MPRIQKDRPRPVVRRQGRAGGGAHRQGLPDLLGDQRSDRSQKAMEAMLRMKEFDIAALQAEFDA